MQDRKIVLDTNLWIYLFTNQDKDKKELIEGIISSLEITPVISMQIYKEIARVLKSKIGLDLDKTLKILKNIKNLSIVMEEYPEDITLALQIREKYNLQFFDSVIYAFALNRNIPIVLSEDIPTKVIEYNGKVVILKNPFTVKQ